MKNYRKKVWVVLLICIILLPITLYTTSSWNILTITTLILTSLTLADTIVYYCYTIPKEKRKMEAYNIRLNQLSKVYEELGFSKEAIEGIRGQMIQEKGITPDGHKTEEKEHKNSI